MLDFNLTVPDLLSLLDDLSDKLNPLITIINITCSYDHYFQHNGLDFKLKLKPVNSHTSHDLCQISHDFCHATCENS